MVEDVGTKALALRMISVYDKMFSQKAYHETSTNQMVISGEDVAQEFKSSGLFDSHLSDIWQEVN